VGPKVTAAHINKLHNGAANSRPTPPKTKTDKIFLNLDKFDLQGNYLASLGLSATAIARIYF